jgi:hypothetical protein
LDGHRKASVQNVIASTAKQSPIKWADLIEGLLPLNRRLPRSRLALARNDS